MGGGNDTIFGLKETDSLKIGDSLTSYSSLGVGDDIVYTVGEGSIILKNARKNPPHIVLGASGTSGGNSGSGSGNTGSSGSSGSSGGGGGGNGGGGGGGTSGTSSSRGGSNIPTTPANATENTTQSVTPTPAAAPTHSIRW